MAGAATNWSGKKSGSRVAAALLALFLTFANSSPAVAGSLQVDPVVLELARGNRAAALTLRNRDSAPSTVRVEVYRWSQRDGVDVYEPAGDMIASPALATIPSGASQLVRVGPRTSPAVDSYRVIVREDPSARGPGTGVKVVLRLDLPLFIGGDPHARAELTWTAHLAADGDLIVEGTNSGARQGRILGISVNGLGREIVSSPRAGTILAHSTRRWSLGHHKELTAGLPVELRIRNEQGEVAAQSVTLGKL